MDKDLKLELDGLKSALEASLADTAKAEVAAQIAEYKSKFDEIETKAASAKDNEINELKSTISKLTSDLEATVKGLEIVNARVKSTGKPAGKSMEVKSFNEMLSEGIQENYDKLRNIKKGETIGFDMKAVADMTFANNFSTADVSVSTLRPGIIELPKRKLHIRQLLTGGSMSNSNYVYLKETAGEEGPETVSEGGTKNQFDLDLQEVSLPNRKIAGYVRITDEMLTDPLGMETFLRSRLLELLLKEEDDQLLNGDGNAPNISGITDSGNYTAYAGSKTIDIEQLVDSISQLEGYDREANGILLHPADYWNICLNRASGGSGTYDLPGIVTTDTNGLVRIAGVPVFRSTAMTRDKFLVGDWTMGANLITRMAPRIEFSLEDGTNFRENKTTVRVEERIAFPIYGDNYFIYGDFGNVS